ncbi:hypothetical protein ACFY62_16020 [Streptomyces sp. NPDC012793]|uniref:hypothetical protein n=1 Tax=unclassified Streptomyces TaxID=2593676 RepID=UPI0036BF2EA0
MPPERTNGAGGTGGGLAVPMAWLCADCLSDELLRAAGLVPPGSLEFRAGRQALALTVHLSLPPDAPDSAARDGAAGRADAWLRRTAHARGWAAWVEERIARRPAAGGEDPDLDLARNTWRTLNGTWMRAADLEGPAATGPGCRVDESVQVWLPAWELGLPLAHLALRLR